jgi:hypothetical protein
MSATRTVKSFEAISNEGACLTSNTPTFHTTGRFILTCPYLSKTLQNIQILLCIAVSRRSLSIFNVLLSLMFTKNALALPYRGRMRPTWLDFLLDKLTPPVALFFAFVVMPYLTLRPTYIIADWITECKIKEKKEKISRWNRQISTVKIVSYHISLKLF